MSRTKNATRNITWGFINKIVSLILPFICRTVMIYTMGTEYTGLGGLFASVLQVLSLAELGVGSAIVYSMYKPIAEGDDEKVCALLNLYKKMYHMIGIVILVIGLILMPFLKYLIKGSYPEDISIYLLYAIYLFNTVISYFLFSYKCSLLNATQRNDISCKIGIFVTLGTYLSQIFVLVQFRNYYIYALVMPIMSITNNIVTAHIATKMYPQYFCKGKLQKSELASIKETTFALVLYKIGSVLSDSFDSIILSAFLGLTTLTMYQNYNYIQNSVGAFLLIITTSIIAGVGNSVVTETIEKNYSDFRKFTLLYMWITGWCTVCLVSLYQPFMKIWVGNDLLFSVEIMIIFCVYFYTRKVGDICYAYRQAAGLWKYDKMRPIIEAVINLIINIVWVKKFGVSGVLISTILCLVFINFGWGTFILFKYYFKRKMVYYVMDQIYYLMITIVGGVITYILCSRLVTEGFLGLIIRMVICVFVPNGIYIMCFFWKKEYKDAILFVKRTFKHKKEKQFN